MISKSTLCAGIALAVILTSQAANAQSAGGRGDDIAPTGSTITGFLNPQDVPAPAPTPSPSPSPSNAGDPTDGAIQRYVDHQKDQLDKLDKEFKHPLPPPPPPPPPPPKKSWWDRFWDWVLDDDAATSKKKHDEALKQAIQQHKAEQQKLQHEKATVPTTPSGSISATPTKASHVVQTAAAQSEKGNNISASTHRSEQKFAVTVKNASAQNSTKTTNFAHSSKSAGSMTLNTKVSAPKFGIASAPSLKPAHVQLAATPAVTTARFGAAATRAK